MSSILIRRAKVIDESSPYHLQTQDILIQDGIITQIGVSLSSDVDQLIDVPNLCVSMGWTDVFADYREPGFEHKETISTGLASAAAGGFTSVMISPNTQPVIGSKSIVQYVLAQALNHPVRLCPVGTVSAQLEGKGIAEMLDMHAHGALAFSDAWKPIQNAGLMLKALEYIKSFGGIIIQLPMDATLSAGGLMHEGVVSTQMGMPGIPVLAESLFLHRDIELLRYTQSRLHVTGISSVESVELIRKAKADGLNISCSVTPYHLALTDESLRSYDSVYKVTPPLRTEEDRQALISAVADGTIDCIASHHRPQEWDAKAKEFEYAGEGMNVQELTFPIALSALQSSVDLTVLVRVLANNPNAIFGLGNDGIKESASANLTLFSEVAVTNKMQLASRSANNPFLNKQLNGAVLGIVNGAKAIIHSEII